MSLYERLAKMLRGYGIEVHEMPVTTGTAQQAADAAGTSPAAIVKSLVLMADDQPILVLASGDARVELARVQRTLKVGSLGMATAAEVRDATGFAIGGVPPLGHVRSLPTYMDSRLLSHSLVYAAAGTPRRIFAVEPKALLQMTGATPIDL